MPMAKLFTWLQSWQQFWTASTPDPYQVSARIRSMERNVVLPVKGVIFGVLVYYLFISTWFDDVTSIREVALQMLQRFFLIYTVVNVAVAVMLISMEQFPLKVIQWTIFIVGLVDALFLAGLTLITGGFDTILYWVFLGLIVRNAVSIPLAHQQITLNIAVSVFYVVAGALDVTMSREEVQNIMDVSRGVADLDFQETGAEPFVLRMVLLLLMTLCCFGVQVLFDKQRQALDEAREYALRQEQLQATGRLAAEIAHQLKNPLGIINNAAFTLQRTVKEGKTITQQIQIIREEVDRSDRIITELMGYAKLAEGRVERLQVNEELDRAVEQVFPAAVKFEVQVHRHYAPALPPLLIQRSHLSEVFVNILQNAREAMDGKGNIWIQTAYGENYTVIVRLRDDGPGIPPEKVSQIFEPYFTTKERGTGLGLAIVKHNTEIYDGTVEVHSELGKGTEFVLRLPARTSVKLRK